MRSDIHYEHFTVITDDAGQLMRLGGESGMGMAYLAEDTRVGRRVVLKLIQPHLVRDETVRRRFLMKPKLPGA